MKKMLVGVVVAVGVWLGIALAADPDTVSREAWRVQVSTNTTTVVTQYTASKAGAMLAGKVNGSNAVWVAVAAGTNGWVRVALGL
jgi:hypothetical protein